MAHRTRNINLRELAERYISIYAICDPDTEEVRYIGETPKLRERILQHLSAGGRKGTAIGLWLAELHANGKEPLFIELCRCAHWPVEHPHARAKNLLENFFIEQAAKCRGGRLLNRQGNPLWRIDPKTRQFVPAHEHSIA